MLIYLKQGWYEYRSEKEGNVHAFGLNNIRSQVIERFDFDIITLLN